MVRKEGLSSSAEAPAGTMRGDKEFARPNPEQGHRLMRAFVNIRETALREAIVDFVTDLSALYGDGQ